MLHAQRVFFEDVLSKRPGVLRESRKSLTFPSYARPPFVLILDYTVYGPDSAAVVEINGARVLEGRAPDGPDGGDRQRVQREVDLSRWETHEIFTRIASPDAGYADVQIVGQVSDGRQ